MYLLFDIQTGISGDMILGALFDLGVDFRDWKERLGALGLPPADLGVEKVSKQGLQAMKFRSQFPPEPGHRTLTEIRKILGQASLSPWVREKSLAVFTRLAEVEGAVHGLAPEQVHFHEVGALDALVDVAGACLGFEMLGVTEFYTTAFTFGTGSVRAAHGRMAVPVPATLALSRGFPSRRTAMPGELCTPTGTAIATTLARPLPPQAIGTVKRIGYGAGARDLPDMGNVLRLCLMERVQFQGGPEGSGNSGYEVFQVECNLDNMTPELVGHAAERLLAAGCKDVWQESILMKKNRSAIKLCALVEPERLHAALDVFAADTATGGMRYFPVRRLVAEKAADSVETRFGKVELKRVEFPGRAAPRLLPEFESCRRIALEQDVPLQAVYREALARAAWREGAGPEAASREGPP